VAEHPLLSGAGAQRKDRGPGEASSSFYLGNRPLLHDRA
jgi:hypothetical protein